MSRHYTDCQYKKQPIRVILGYDRPLDHYYMIIQYREGACKRQSPFVYASNSDPDDPRHDLDYYGDKLTALGIEVPGEIFESVWIDALNRRGNYIVEHFADGTQRVVYDESNRTLAESTAQ